ncbi:unnamed protein product [Candida verbasci]|uniref:GPI transamidase component GAB1 n=1 Tax=Candida verbasci TaxID=1227364 RepID=A0A9W4XBR2_9ASCO|nr:unnamed protein product [Candida verbasci]
MSKLAQVFLIGALIRFIIPSSIPSITTILSSTVELSTPINSFKSLLESFYYLNHDINLYDGGVNHNPPLLVSILSIIYNLPYSNILFNALYTVIDLFIAYRLILINRWYNNYQTRKLGEKKTGFNDDLIASFYLFNPLIVLANLSHSTTIFSWLFTIESIYQIISGNSPRGMIALSISSYLSYYPLYLLPSILSLSHILSKERNLSKSLVFGGCIFLMSLTLLLMVSVVITSSFQFIDHCYFTILCLKKITPNVGLWWYLFTEMFEFFTPFYLGMFNLYSFIFIIPITLRLFEFKQTPKLGDSFLAIILSYIWISFTKTYPTIGDLGLALSLIPIISSTVLKYCKMMYITGITLIISLLLSPIFYYCWIVLGNGNSNFFYSINLIWGAVQVMIMMDLVWGKLIMDYSIENNIKSNEIGKLNLAQI